MSRTGHSRRNIQPHGTLSRITVATKRKELDGTCQQKCDICKASCIAEPKKCDRWLNHRENGHVCVAHSDEARQEAAAAQARRGYRRG